MINTDTGRAILREIRNQLYRIPKTKYPYLYQYIGTDKTKLRIELRTVLNYLINPQNEKNQSNAIENRFFTAYNQYCFYLDTDAYTKKIRKAMGGRYRSNKGINMLCCIGIFSKDKDLTRYKVNQEFRKAEPKKRLMSIYHFRRIDLDFLEANAKRLYKADITVSNLSAVNLRAGGLDDIADAVFFRNKPAAYGKKAREANKILDTLDMIIDSQGYATKGDLLSMLDIPQKEVDKVLKAFRTYINTVYRYGVATKAQREEYGYTLSKWIYTKREE